MSVYVDGERNGFGRMVMCHTWADALAELHAMADAIGMRRDWFQPLSFPHYDVSLSRRAVAVELGAVQVDRREGSLIRKRIRERGFSDADLAEIRAAIPAYDAKRKRRVPMNKAAIGIVEKLERQADQTSSIHREMAEAKSLRQESNTERRTDLYMWPTPEQTTEGQAAAIIMEMVEALELSEQFLDKANALASGEYLSSVAVLAERFVEVRDQARTLITKVRGK